MAQLPLTGETINYLLTIPP
ncbi:MAG: hypothetical protein AB8C46_01490 [Burkholderiaceae bacterium]